MNAGRLSAVKPAVWCGYLLLVALLAWSLTTARTSAIARLDNPSARQAWRDWQSAAQRQNARPNAPVKRRIATIDEPPLLVLLRDHFAAVMVVVLVVATALYVFFVMIAGGIRRQAKAR